MTFFKKKFSLFLLLCLVYLAYFLFHQPTSNSISTQNRQVLGAQSDLLLFAEPESGHKPIIDAIDNAQKEIDMEMYLLSDKQVITSLENAKLRGVVVKVMLEEHPFGGGSNQKTQQTLQADGIPFEWTSSSFTLTHEKGIIIDNSIFFVLTQNLTASAFTKNREYDIEDTNPQDVLEAKTIFTDDWQRKSFNPATSNLVISPNTSRSLITSLLTSAKQTIDIEMEEVQDSQIISLLAQKAKTVRIQIIVPTKKQLSANETYVKQLEQAGIQVDALSSPYMHAKMILVDDSRAYIGSVNLSTQSMDSNRELGIIVSQGDIVGELSSDFANDFAKSLNFY